MTAGLGRLEDWLRSRNLASPDDVCPKDILSLDDANLLDKWLSLFTIEVRRKDGSEYPPATIHMLLCGLQHVMRCENKNPLDIFAKNDVRLRRFHGTMETVFQELHKKGVGAAVKHTPSISSEEEDRVWEAGIMGDKSPTALLNAVFFLNGMNFSLRGGKEHRELKRSQLIREGDHWKYIEHGSKSFRGGMGDLHRENKVVRQYPIACKERCHVRLLDLYVSKLPEGTNDVFYCTAPRITPSDPSKPWYLVVPVGWKVQHRSRVTSQIHASYTRVLPVPHATRLIITTPIEMGSQVFRTCRKLL